MGICQSCRNLPANVTSCGNSCADSNCGLIVCDEREGIGGMVGVQALTSMTDRVGSGTDPVGAIFEETLEQLDPLDRELMLFCATSNVLAVRWLLHLGANWDTTDTNGSTCMHVACRAGSLQVVTELLSYKPLLDTTDLAKWSPLHIAAFMGRREAVVRLLHANASPNVQNLNRQAPADLSPDFGTLAAFKESSGELDSEDLSHAEVRWHETDNGDAGDNVGAPLECEHIPFFLPPVPAIRSLERREPFWNIAVVIFNRQPSYGLAFTVATGLASNYADALLKLLQCENVNRAQVGGFLGEALSLSSLTRLSLFDSIPMYNTGVVATLKCAFRVFQLPDDFQKINRLLSGLAHVWWRRHKDSVNDDLDQDEESPHTGMTRDPSWLSETCGFELRVSLASIDSLAQFMFSTVMLHWSMYRDGLSAKRHIPFPLWTQLNRGIGAEGMDIPDRMQKSVYDIINQGFLKELALAPPRKKAGEVPSDEVHWERLVGATTKNYCQGRMSKTGGPDDAAGLPRTAASWHSSLTPVAVLEGWASHHPSGAKLVGSGLPSSMTEIPASLSASSMRMAYVSAGNSLDGVMSEVLRAEASFLSPQKGAKIWLSLCSSLLFFQASTSSSSSSSSTPHMFLDLLRTRVLRCAAAPFATTSEGAEASNGTKVKSKEDRLNVITLVGQALPTMLDERRGKQAQKEGGGAAGASSGPGFLGEDANQVSAAPESPLISIVHLLPDGRWQELYLNHLELHLPSQLEADVWEAHLVAPQHNSVFIQSLASYTDATLGRTQKAKLGDEMVQAEEMAERAKSHASLASSGPGFCRETDRIQDMEEEEELADIPDSVPFPSRMVSHAEDSPCTPQTEDSMPSYTSHAEEEENGNGGADPQSSGPLGAEETEEEPKAAKPTPLAQTGMLYKLHV